MKLDKENLGVIDINLPASAAILAGILDIPVSMVYQGRTDGKLPARTEASYKDCIQQYITFYKRKINSKSSSMGEAKLEQDIRNGIAKEELQWLQVKKEKELLVDLAELKDLFEPIFHLVKSSLVNLTRKYPETEHEVDNMLNTWFTLGEKLAERASSDSASYVQAMLDKEVELPEAEEQLESQFKNFI